MLRKRDIAMYAVALVLAFVVGTLVGGECSEAPTAPEPPPVVAAAICDPVREVVYECPPDAGTPAPKVEAPGTPVRAVAAKKRDLPPPAPPITPRQRKQLLAWVRDQSVDLEGCRSAAKETYRLSVTLELDEAGAVTAVRLNAPTAEVPSTVSGCLRQRMRAWAPPPDLVAGRRELVFGLTL